MAAGFSLFVPRESGLHRLHPLTTLALAGFCLTVGLVASSVTGIYLIFLTIILPLAVWGRLVRPLLGRLWRLVLPFAISVFLIQGIFWHGGTPFIDLGLFSFKREGILFAAASTGRIIVVVSSFLMLSLATRPDRLMIALSQRGLPGSLTYIVLSTLQIVPRFQTRAQTILDAQRSRGLETGGNLLQRSKALLPLVVPLVLGSFIDIEERAIALEARGFSRQGKKTSFVQLEDSRSQRAIRLLVLLTGLVAVLTRLGTLFIT